MSSSVEHKIVDLPMKYNLDFNDNEAMDMLPVKKGIVGKPEICDFSAFFTDIPEIFILPVNLLHKNSPVKPQ